MPLFTHSANNESAIVSGTFAGGSVATGRRDQSESRENPLANNRVRGIGAATTTCDTFITDIPFDADNSSGVTICRGPNPRARRK